MTCAPAEPTFDEQQFEELVKAPTPRRRNGATPCGRASRCAQPRSRTPPVVEKLGMQFVRVMPDEEPRTSRRADDAGGGAERQGRLRPGRGS